MKKTLLAFALFSVALAATAADSPKDVQALIARGDYSGAEAMLRQAVSEHPQSAKAHYVLAEVLAHEGNIGDAKAEAGKAATLDPAIRFTDPTRFEQFQSKLNQALAPESSPRTSARQATYGAPAPVEATPRASSFPLTGLLVIGGVIALIAFLWSRRRRAVAPPFPNAPYGTPQQPPPPPYGGYQGYGNNYAPPPTSSGVGAAVAAGVGGLAAGALLDEAFRSHRGEEQVRDAGFMGGGNEAPQPSQQAYDDLRDEPIDMGNNDSSWDQGGSDDSGSDDNQW
ncbi:tetratricopeptide repeat protein [Luteibacter sp. 9135]|uniref:tetratricopeptide repeat protein n=1 Tax=Luteibacter sp. 9135 TaxID=1500893 RepID=UPI000561C352|nr:tetratricopeptide repeat protein [Luteibacter sp. 9135]